MLNTATRFGANGTALPARLLMPSPAPLLSLREALARRAEVFGPYDGDEPPTTPRGGWQALGAVARRVADLLDPQPAGRGLA